MKQYVINKADLTHNIGIIKDMADSAKVIAVLKGSGYGLGIVEFAGVLKDNGIDFFAVSEVEEAKTLRDAGFDNDILLLTATAVEEEIKTCLDLDVILSAGSADAFEKISALAGENSARVHLKIDTGFGRFGFSCDDIENAAECVKKYENINVEGVFSHFSFSFSDKRADVQLQYDRFLNCIEKLENDGITNLLKHICNSCAFLQYKDMHLDAVRVGSAFLGRLPLNNCYGLKRIGAMRSNVIEVKTLPAGYHVGYANTYTTKKETQIAVVPIGYKDGYGVEKSRDTFRFMDILRYMYNDFRTLGKKNTVSICGRPYPLIGRISMYNIIVDVTGADVKVGDIVETNANPILVSKDVQRVYE
ncbi:MAG: alanine racemase [Clostridia bacterium]|nr:alanine racemase [Clostridia bacterium]